MATIDHGNYEQSETSEKYICSMLLFRPALLPVFCIQSEVEQLTKATISDNNY